MSLKIIYILYVYIEMSMMIDGVTNVLWTIVEINQKVKVNLTINSVTFLSIFSDFIFLKI